MLYYNPNKILKTKKMVEVITTETMALENNSVKCFPSNYEYNGYACMLLSTNNMDFFGKI